MRRGFTLLFSVALTASFACVHHHHHGGASPQAVVVHEPGPPPHAPAHGYRHRHPHYPDVELVFDSSLGLYVAVDLDGVFFHHDHFYREIDGVWHWSRRPTREWVVVKAAKLPPGLAKKHHKAKRKHKKYHRFPAKYEH